MSAEHERVKEILAEAAGKATPEARAAYLDAACSGDAALRRQVEGLLEAHARAGDFLEQSVLPPEEKPIGEGPGTIIGRYKLLEEIGEGGFGRVFMAEQTEPVHRKVALKIIKAGMDTREVIARFEAERQALALMDHPNIARVLDAGATESGRPYFVMELVRGMPITGYCDQQQLPTAERLQLFMKVCAAVQHAHQKGIIHRDLKPTNILVTLVDGEAVPKVIDFGVAKALGQKLTEKTLFTAFHQMIGTPAYMSPEQAALSGVDVDTRSDIYSLGVLLYELLTGVTPFDADTLRKAALDEIRRLIRETEPPKPSTRLMELARGQKSEGRSQKWKEVHGDLDWIAMKCLEKDRGRRYETANNLAQDIERHLNHEPVTAAAPGTAYRLGKFVRRHRFGFATATALIVLLVAGVAVSTWQAVRATRAEKEAKTVATFLRDMLNSVKSEQARGKDTTLLRQMLDQAAARVDKELKSQPLTEAWMRNTLGAVYLALGEYPKAEPMFRRSFEVREHTLGKEHPLTLQSLHNLAELLYVKGDYAGAEPLCRRALEAHERTLGKEHPDALASVNSLANLLAAKADFAGAEALYRRALEASERTLGKEHPRTLLSVDNLATLLSLKLDYAGAEPLCRRALEARERTLGKEHPDTLGNVNNLACLLEDKADYAGAEPLYRRALEAEERTMGKKHPDTLNTVYNLARLLDKKGDYAGAEPLYRRALEEQEGTLGKEHPSTLASACGLAGLLRAKGDYAGAEPLNRRVLEAAERTLGKEHPDTLVSIYSLALLLEAKGDYAGAEPLYRRALEGRERALGKEHPNTLKSVYSLANLLEAKGDYAGAEPFYRRAVAMYRHLADQGDAAAQNRLAKMYAVGKGVTIDEGEAMRWYRRSAETESPQTLNDIAWAFATSGNPKLRDGHDAVVFAQKAAVATDRKRPEYLDTLAAAYAEAGQFTNAATVQREAMALLQTDAQKDDYASRLRLYESGYPYRDHALLEKDIGQLLADGKFAEAEPLARECLTIREIQIPEDWKAYNARCLLGGSLLGQKKCAEAEPLLLSGCEGMKQREEKIPAAGRPLLKEALQRLVQLYETTGRTDQAAECRQKLAEFEKAEAEKLPAPPPH